MKAIEQGKIEEVIVEVRGEKVILDSSVAVLYGVETKRVNEAVKNNRAKFPTGYIIHLGSAEWNLLKTKFSTSKRGGKVKLPYAFTEKGLYMLATVLKSRAATLTTIGIIEAFAKMREFAAAIRNSAVSAEPEVKEDFLRRGGEIISKLIDKEMEVTNTETSVEINLALIKFKHLVKRGKGRGKGSTDKQLNE